ncbi:MAG: hypothetical protein WCA10_13600, partial [Terracidiphilus sp.]
MNPTPAFEASPAALRLDIKTHEEGGVLPPTESRAGANETRNTRLFHRMCVLVLLIVVSAASFSAFYQKWHFREQGARGTDLIAEFDRMIDGTAHRPYIYRQLLPDLANSLTRVLPGEAIARRVPQRAKDRISVAFNLSSKKYPAQYLIFYIATYLFALLAAAALYMVCAAANVGEPVAVFAAVVFMLLFPHFGVKGGYFCDYPELFFMAAAFWIALKLDWWWVIPVAALGTWNKESFLLFMFTLYPVFRRRHSRVSSLIGVGVQVAVCAAVYLPIRHAFAHNAGGTVEWHLRDQIDFYLHPFKMDTWVDRTYDLMFPALSAPIPMLMLIWVVWRGWRLLPLWVKRHAQIAAAINIPLFLLFCQPGEFRDLSLLYVSFLLILAVNLREWVGSAGT